MAYISNQEMLGGALIVRKNDEIIYQNKWGFQNLEHSRSIEYDTMYRLMSMSKCVTGVAVMKLIEEGKIRLDDKVSKYIPEFAGLSRLLRSTLYKSESEKTKDGVESSYFPHGQSED